jgi:anti-anti-sigma factor
MDLIVNKEIQGSTIIFHVKGTLDISTTNIIDSNLEQLEENIERLIFDLKDLDFIDSTGIGSIINAIHLSQEKNFKLVLQEIDELTNQVFETVGLYQILDAIQGEVM